MQDRYHKHPGDGLALRVGPAQGGGSGISSWEAQPVQLPELMAVGN